MYWGVVFLVISLLALPFAMGGALVSASAALILVVIFSTLSVMSFVFGRERRDRVLGTEDARNEGRRIKRID